MPIYFREPHINIGIGNSSGVPPHIVGRHLVKHFDLSSPSLIHAFSSVDYDQAVETFGKVGGFAHLATLVKQLRGEFGERINLCC